MSSFNGFEENDHDLYQQRKRKQLEVFAEFLKDEEESQKPSFFIPRNIVDRSDPKTCRWYVQLEERRERIKENPSFVDPTFRKEFRLPFELMEDIFSWVKIWHSSKDAFGRQRVPVELLVLSTFKIIGFGVTFFLCSMDTFIGEETIRNFFHTFMHIFAKHLYPVYCKMPNDEEEINKISEVYNSYHLPGCIGSIDVTHFTWWRATTNLKQYCSSRYHRVTLAYEVVTDHNRYCLHCTKGFYGSFNDKTIVKFDNFVDAIRRNDLFLNYEYDLFDLNGNPSIERGVYLISDNGYHPWRVLQYPSKNRHNEHNIYYHDWSKNVESVRKDVECFFGILKQRWKILKYGFRFKKISLIDNIVMTCCCLHNMLLEYDANNGRNANDEIIEDEDIEREDIVENGEEEEENNQNNNIIVGEAEKFAHNELHFRLVRHFSFQRNK